MGKAVGLAGGVNAAGGASEVSDLHLRLFGGNSRRLRPARIQGDGWRSLPFACDSAGHESWRGRVSRICFYGRSFSLNRRRFMGHRLFLFYGLDFFFFSPTD